ncbi:uncharacterized protein LOC108914922 [Anoplophora glabripennis]|uniref:uncharacterized protein LOC108914922 n=1 Tax=Anoplophora glabripennis TaxID=217634 RepID=UPI0008747BDE|nr:uncharacterized protein LOC108914922 [Anoplophora glabripennis]
MFDILNTISVKFTEEELKECLRNVSGSDAVVIISIEAGNGSEKKGDSYLSTIYRFTVEAVAEAQEKDKNIRLHVIAKGIPKNVARRKTFRSLDFFQTEVNFYNNVWPLMKKLKDSKNFDEADEVPMVLSSFSNGENDYVALKDLSFEGYETVQRDIGIDQDYALLFLKLLANFHALSIAARHLDPEFEKVARSLKETYFDERFRSWYSGFMENKLNEVIRNAVRTQLDSVYLEKINKFFSSDSYGLVCKLAKGPPSKLLAVTQGDVWTPNFLVKLQNGRPVNGILIDFQLARYASITGDLIQFLYSCISQEVLLKEWDNLVDEYHRQLSKRIGELGCDPNLITLGDLKEDIQKNGQLGLAMAMESTVMSSLKEHEVPDLDTIQGDEPVPLEQVWDISPFDDVPRNKRVAFIIKHAVDKGFM